MVPSFFNCNLLEIDISFLEKKNLKSSNFLSFSSVYLINTKFNSFLEEADMSGL